MSHRNAPLTPTGRLRLARCIVDDGWPLRRAADRFQMSVSTAQRWAGRYREQGREGMVDRSSRPRTCPHRLPVRTERRIMGLRVSRRWGPARIAYRSSGRTHPSCCAARSGGCGHLLWCDPRGRRPGLAPTARPAMPTWPAVPSGNPHHPECERGRPSRPSGAIGAARSRAASWRRCPQKMHVTRSSRSAHCASDRLAAPMAPGRTPCGHGRPGTGHASGMTRG